MKTFIKYLPLFSSASCHSSWCRYCLVIGWSFLALEWKTRTWIYTISFQESFRWFVTHFLFLFSCCVWKQSACESKNFPCGEKAICIPDYHGKNFKCKCKPGQTGTLCGKCFLLLKLNIKTSYNIFERLSGAEPTLVSTILRKAVRL